MTAHSNHPHPTTYECVDQYPEYLTGLNDNTDGALFHFIKADCSGVGTTGYCLPYDEYRPLTCVVCSK